MSDAIVEEILSAKTHYQVLGVAEEELRASHHHNNTEAHDSEARTAALRKAYLRRSVKVHPDKNSHPDATQAFQRVAQAWQVLGDATKRAAYDAALQRGGADMQEEYNEYNEEDNNFDGKYSHPRYAQRGETYYAGPPPSMQEALFLFATVVGTMSGGSTGRTMSNLTEALYWAERFLRQNEASSQQRGLDGNGEFTDAASLSNQEKASLAMAVGSGLKVASSAARSLGMNQSAAAMEKGAKLAQMAGVGAMVADKLPKDTVQKVLKSGSEGWKKLRSSMQAVQTVLKAQQQQGHQQQQQGKE